MLSAQHLPSIALTARDAANIYLESDRSPANIITTAIVDAAALRVERSAVEQWMTDRLNCSPIFRRRLRRSWADITYPEWVEDPDLVVAEHVTVTAADDWAAAEAVISRLVEARMDLTRPPWDLTIIDGVRGLGDDLPARSAILVLRFHHSIGDGVVTAATFKRMLSETPEFAAEETPPKRRSTARAPIDLAKYVGAVLGGPRLARAMAQVGGGQPVAPTVSRFNHPIEGHPALGLLHFDLGQIRDVRRAVAGATLNDVLLAVIAGALGRLLSDLDEDADRVLSAAMPIAVDDRAGTGNKYALGIVALDVGEMDPVERLRLIHRATSTEKERQRHPAFVRHRSITNSIPAYVTRITGRRARNAVGAKPGPATMISNVPSLLRDATFMGEPVVDRVSFLTIADGGTLAHFVTSVGDRVAVSFTVDSAVLPEPRVYDRMLREAFDELLAAAMSPAQA